jgi:hypothetical protein
MSRLPTLILISCFSLAACDKKDDAASKQADKQGKALEQDDKPAKPPEPPPPDPASKIDSLAVIPAELPATIEAACDAMAEQLDLINQAKLTGDDLTKWNTGGKEGVLTPAKTMCIQRGSIPEAACAAAGMKSGGVEIEPLIGDLMAACAKKAAG